MTNLLLCTIIIDFSKVLEHGVCIVLMEKFIQSNSAPTTNSKFTYNGSNTWTMLCSVVYNLVQCGVTWTQKDISNPSNTELHKSGNMWVAKYKSGTIYVSTNGTSSWTAKSDMNKDNYRIFEISMVYLGGNGIYWSDITTWTKATDFSPIRYQICLVPESY